MKITTQGNVSPRSAWKIHRSQFNYGIRILGYISSWQQNLAGNSHSTYFTGIKDARVGGPWKLMPRSQKTPKARQCVARSDSWQAGLEGPFFDAEKMKP